MKKIFFIGIVFCFVQIISATEKDSINHFSNFKKFYKVLDDCDACGCSAGNGSSGLGTFLNPQFIGIKYFYQNYKVRENIFVKEPKTNEFYNTVSLWARIPIGKKIEIYANLPYMMLQRDIQPKIATSGMRDMTIMGNWNVLKTFKKIEKTPHNLSLAFGIKLPTGKYEKANTTSTNPSFQLGTNSWDYISGINYMYKKETWAIQLYNDYTIKTENRNYYKFGNQWNTMLMGYYLIDLGNDTRVSPKFGFSSEVYQKDEQLKDKLVNTAGYAVFGKGGFEFAVKRFSLGMELMMPVSQNLRNGEIKVVMRSAISINYAL